MGNKYVVVIRLHNIDTPRFLSTDDRLVLREMISSAILSGYLSILKVYNVDLNIEVTSKYDDIRKSYVRDVEEEYIYMSTVSGMELTEDNYLDIKLTEEVIMTIPDYIVDMELG